VYSNKLTKFSAHLLTLEPLLLAMLLGAFWFPIEIRANWLWLLAGVPVLMLARWLIYGRLFTRFPLDLVFGLFIALMVLNTYLAPYTRGLYMLGRPLLGMALCVYFVEHVRHRHHMGGVLLATLGLVLLVGGLALFSSQWNSKSDQLRFLIDILPKLTGFPGAEGGFNANEIAGALTWLVPLSAGFAAGCTYTGRRRLDGLLRAGFLVGFLITFAALLLGQSRFGLLGVLLALGLLTPVVLGGWRRRAAAWGLLLVIAVLEIMIIRHVFSPAKFTTQLERDEDSLSTRFDIWGSAVAIVRDYPFTGVGMNMFRDGRVRQRYPVASFTQPVLPHTHNELLQIATDVGLPGLVWFGMCYLVAAWMLWRVYRTGTAALGALAGGTGAALMAHLIYSLGDAVPLWDRFSFVFWWILALCGILYMQNHYTQSQHQHNEI
jgi:O-antigen ligase